jgi:hypothetical protein
MDELHSSMHIARQGDERLAGIEVPQPGQNVDTEMYPCPHCNKDVEWYPNFSQCQWVMYSCPHCNEFGTRFMRT